MVDTSSGRKFKPKPKGLFAPPEPGKTDFNQEYLVKQREAKAKEASMASQAATQSISSETPTHVGKVRDLATKAAGLFTDERTAAGFGNKIGGLSSMLGLGALDAAEYGRPGEALEMAVGGPAASVGKGIFKTAAKDVLKEGLESTVGTEAKAAAESVGTSMIGHNGGPRMHDGTVGDINNPDVLFEGVSPHDFTSPSQWGRFGRAHGRDDVGPLDDQEWYNSLVPIQSKSGKQYTIPGGLEDPNKPFSYYDILHVKAQGINPNDLDPNVHRALHNRMLTTMSPQGEIPPHQVFNQLSLAQISPNQPLTPNELAVARTMAKGPEDLERWGNMIPWKHSDTETPKEIMKNPDGTDMMRQQPIKQGKKIVGYKSVPVTKRKYYNDKIANEMGLGAGAGGGLGARGTADYTRIAETAQRIREKPEFFRFKGAGEGGADSAANWSNFVERLSSQTPGLSAKTGSFGAVWQNPKEANISAVDRHMANLFTEDMFPSQAEFQKFEQDAVAKYNKASGKNVSTLKEMPDGPRNDAMFGYLNTHPDMKYRNAKGELNPALPEHLRPENANWVHEPESVSLISQPYQRVLGANARKANSEGQSTFGGQWMHWDRKRNREEPHEIMHPALQALPRMSQKQMHVARKELADAGYFASNKDPEGDLQPVRPLSSASRAAYFSLPVGAGVGGAALLNGAPGEGGGEAQAATPHPGVDNLHGFVQNEAASSGRSNLDILREMFFGGQR